MNMKPPNDLVSPANVDGHCKTNFRFRGNAILESFLSFLAGIILVFAFAPFHIFWVALISPAILFWLLSHHSPTKSAFIGFCFGCGFFGLGVSWVFVSIYVFGGTPTYLAALITLLFVFVLALFFALMGFLLQKYFNHNNILKIILVYPTLWALLEALRSWIFTGFPWLILGHTVENNVFAGFGPIFGAYGCSFWVIFASSLCYLAATPHFMKNPANQKSPWKTANAALLALAILLVTAYLSNFIHWTKAVEKPLNVSLVQGNIQQSLRWDPEEVNHILLTYQALTRNHYQNNLIVWPEAAIPLTPEEAAPFLKKINAKLEAGHSSLLTGIPLIKNGRYYNAVIALGHGYGSYTKRHLVPFGEYVPFEKYLRGLIQFFDLPMSNYLSGPVQQSLITINDVPIGVYVCYEIAYDYLVREDLPMAGLLVTVSDDAWFGRSLAPWQHLEIAQFQALASGRSMLFVSNTGITAIINNKGQIQSIIKQFEPGVLSGKTHEYFGATPWSILGDGPWIMLMLILLSACFSSERRRVI